MDLYMLMGSIELGWGIQREEYLGKIIKLEGKRRDNWKRNRKAGASWIKVIQMVDTRC